MFSLQPWFHIIFKFCNSKLYNYLSVYYCYESCLMISMCETASCLVSRENCLCCSFDYSPDCLMQVHRHFQMMLMDGWMWKMLPLPIFKHLKFLRLMEDIVWQNQWYIILKLLNFYISYTLCYNFQTSKFSSKQAYIVLAFLE